MLRQILVFSRWGNMDSCHNSVGFFSSSKSVNLENKILGRTHTFMGAFSFVQVVSLT